MKNNTRKNNLLPKKVKCPFCSEYIELDKEERKKGRFTCPKCNKTIEEDNVKIWICTKCGEENEINFDVCWNCGSNKDGEETENKQTFDEVKQEVGNIVSNNNSFSQNLRIVGKIMIFLGIVVGIFLLVKLSQGGYLSESKVTFTNVIISMIVAFYHYVSGMICIGIAEILDKKDKQIIKE